MSADQTSIRRLGPGDEGAVEAFLRRHAATSIFLRSNLRESGLRAGTIPFHGHWVAAESGGEIQGIAAHFWNGTLILQAPDDVVGLSVAALGASGRALERILGPYEQAEAVRVALAATRMAHGDGREALFHLPLGDLRVPEILRSDIVTCRPGTPRDREMLLGWRMNFLDEAMGLPDNPIARRAEGVMIDRLIADGWQFVLEREDEPVAMAGYNAALPDTVQMGGVWTPERWRGRGYGRAVVAGALLTARTRGVADAILFTNETNHAARRAYAALGFARIGTYALILFAD